MWIHSSTNADNVQSTYTMCWQYNQGYPSPPPFRPMKPHQFLSQSEIGYSGTARLVGNVTGELPTESSGQPMDPEQTTLTRKVPWWRRPSPWWSVAFDLVTYFPFIVSQVACCNSFHCGRCIGKDSPTPWDLYSSCLLRSQAGHFWAGFWSCIRPSGFRSAPSLLWSHRYQFGLIQIV